MILSGWKRSATRRAKSRITRIGMSAPQYLRSGVFADDFGRFFALSLLYPPPRPVRVAQPVFSSAPPAVTIHPPGPARPGSGASPYARRHRSRHPSPGTGRPLILGGVRIEHPRGLAGHSDADVVLHALTDALLGAAGLGDIGDAYPDTDPRWHGADSALFLT